MQTKTFIVSNLENLVVQDAYSMLTTNIYLRSEAREIKTLVITAYDVRIGKTTLSANLAMTMATWGRKTLLVDADMRKTINAERLSGEVTYGIFDYLKGRVELEEALCKTNVENLTYMPSGNISGNPIGILCSGKFKDFLSRVQDKYDLIIFDTPALSSVSDASVIAAMTDATLLVAKMGKTNLVSLKRAKDQLEKVNAFILGVVLNRVKKRDYKRYFKSYNYFFNAKKISNKGKIKGRSAVTM